MSTTVTSQLAAQQSDIFYAPAGYSYGVDVTASDPGSAPLPISIDSVNPEGLDNIETRSFADARATVHAGTALVPFNDAKIRITNNSNGPIALTVVFQP